MSNLPGWLRRQTFEDDRNMGLAELAVARQLAQFPIRDSPRKARGYRIVGQYFSLGDDVIYPRDREISKALKEFDPYLVPMWVNWVYLAPDSDRHVVFGRHALGRYCPELAHEGADPIKCAVPYTYNGYIPNKLICIFEGEKNENYRDIPGKYIPWDWRIYKTIVQSSIHNRSVRELKQEQRERVLQDERELQAKREEDNYIRRELDAYVTKKLEQMSDVELKEFALHGRKQMRRDPRPFVFHRS